MKKNRRQFLKLTGMTGLGVASGGMLKSFASTASKDSKKEIIFSNSNFIAGTESSNDENLSIIGLYGDWAASLIEKKLPAFSFRRKELSNLETWRKSAKKRLIERLAIPDIGGVPKVNINKQYTYDGLQI